ncbi:MAG: hypothetical protein KME20_28545 [Kaiparowitsia implicata GSE-PSE-MK54-09C]|jgi:hypothetical protein|nr:hypothetical protein [Kaiparowitsia implicata GSE-PSE-MK54-09C]
MTAHALLERNPSEPSADGVVSAASGASYPTDGKCRDLGIGRDCLLTVLRLSSTYSQPKKELPDPARYIDISGLERVLDKVGAGATSARRKPCSEIGGEDRLRATPQQEINNIGNFGWCCRTRT